MYEAFSVDQIGIFSEDDQKLMAQNVMDWLIDFFKWETYTEEELFEMGIVGGGDGFDLLAEGEFLQFVKENFTPKESLLTEILLGTKGDAKSCPIANTIRHAFPNSRKVRLEVNSSRISIENVEPYDTINIPCEDTPIDYFVGAFDAGHLPMYQRSVGRPRKITEEN